MKMPDRPSDTEVACDVEAWLKRGGSITRLRAGKSCRRPLTFEGINAPGRAEPERQRGEPEPDERV